MTKLNEEEKLVDRLQIFLGKFKDAIKSGHGDTMTATWAIDLERMLKQEMLSRIEGMREEITGVFEPLMVNKTNVPEYMSDYAREYADQLLSKIKEVLEWKLNVINASF